MSSLLIQNASVLYVAPDASTASILYEHDVLIAGNRIEGVQPSGQADPSHFDETIRADGLLLMPGLINTHAHVPMVIFRGLAEDVPLDVWFNDYIWPLEHNLTPDDVSWGMLLGAAEMIEGGITFVSDHYFHANRGAAAIEQSGMRALLNWAYFGSDGMAGVERGGRFAQEYQGAAGGRITTNLGPHATYTCDDDILRATAQLAARLGVPVHIHAAETMGQTRISLDKRGQTPIEVLEATGLLEVPIIIAHGCGITPGDIERLSGRQAGIATAPKTYLKLAMGMTPIVALRQAGIPVGLATDGAVSNNTLDLWEALRLTAMMQKDRAGDAGVLPIAHALHVATRGSAKLVGMEGELGAVEPGYLADLILVDLEGTHHQPLYSPTTSLVYNTRASDVRTVIIDGRVVMRDRQLMTIDKLAVIDYVRAQMGRLSRRDRHQRVQSYSP